MLNIIEFEVETKMAFFSRVDSSASLAQSYPFPTPSAVEGICNSIVGVHLKRKCAMRAEYVKVCSQLQTGLLKTNSHAIMRNPNLIQKQSAQECRRSVLYNQRWIFGVRSINVENRRSDDEIVLHQMFKRYIEKNKQIKNPSCGHSEMIPSYLGVVRPDAIVNTSFTMFVPDFLLRVWDRIIDGNLAPFYADVKIENGFFDYTKARIENNVL